MEKSKEIRHTEAILNFMNGTKNLLPTEESKEYFKKHITGLQNALEMANNKEKEAYLQFIATQVVDQFVYAMFRENTLTEEAEKAYRFLPIRSRDAAEDYNHFKEGREKERQKLLSERDKQFAHEQDFEVFQAVCTGMDKEEAIAKQKEYQDKLAQNMGA